MTHTDLMRAWRAHASARAAARLEDDARPAQLSLAQALQDEAEIALDALAGTRPAGGPSRDSTDPATPEELRARLAARRISLSFRFVTAHLLFARRTWTSLSARGRVSVAVVAFAVIAAPLIAWKTTPKDLARGRSWTASSIAEGAAKSGRLGDGKAKYFFHTKKEQGPSLEIDLERIKKIQRVVITNREDCCQPRALPLVVESSEDRKHWKPLARRERPFDRWEASFGSTRARFLRLSVGRESWLHLKDVAVY